MQEDKYVREYKRVKSTDAEYVWCKAGKCLMLHSLINMWHGCDLKRLHTKSDCSLIERLDIL